MDPYHNGEGYIDKTAGAAICNAARSRKGDKTVPKKRSCRRTQGENKIHEKAVKLRRMTDEQLVHYVEERVSSARNEGFNQGRKSVAEQTVNITEIMNELSNVRGIGAVKMKQIRIVLENRIGGCPNENNEC